LSPRSIASGVTGIASLPSLLIPQTGPGTPCGQFLRSYWQPIAAAEEMPIGGAPLPIRIMSEDLVLFRDDKGKPVWDWRTGK